MDGRGDAITAPVAAAGTGMRMRYQSLGTHHLGLGAARDEHPMGARGAKALIPGDLSHVCGRPLGARRRWALGPD